MSTRPPIGFVVEGHTEHNSYPSLVSRILDRHGFRIPIVNAASNGSVIRNLQNHLRDLALSHKPFEVIVTLDLRDVINQCLVPDCAQLVARLANEAGDFLAAAAQDPRLNPLPENIKIVVQIQQFETWIISDAPNLREAGYIGQDHAAIYDVDNNIANPASWLRANLVSQSDFKNPLIAKGMISALDPAVMRTNSPSFDKFAREVEASFESWEQLAFSV